MKKRIELDVDFIGGDKRPTKEEFLAISEFLKTQKSKRKIESQKKITQDNKVEKLPA